MPATWNPDVLVQLFGSAQAVQRKSFGLVCLATAAVEAGFTDTYAIYESNSDAQADANLSAATKAAIAAFYSQPVHPTRVMVAKVAYASLATDLSALIVATPSDDRPYIFCCADRTTAYQTALAGWALANDSLAAVQTSEAASLTAGASLFLTLATVANGRAFGTYHDDDTEWLDMSWAAAGAAMNPDDRAGTWFDKTLAGIPTAEITAAQKGFVVANYGNLYLPLLGVGATGPGTLFDGAWIDEIVSDDWLRARIQEAVAQLKLDVAARGERIPYTNAGLAMIEAAIRGPCDKAVAVGHYQSYVIGTPDIADVLAADITARRCTIPVTATRSGGIRTVTVNVGVIDA